MLGAGMDVYTGGCDAKNTSLVYIGSRGEAGLLRGKVIVEMNLGSCSLFYSISPLDSPHCHYSYSVTVAVCLALGHYTPQPQPL